MKPLAMNTLVEAAIVNSNSSGQGYDADYVNHPLHSTIVKHGYSYSHTTPYRASSGETIHHHHTYAKGEHKVGISTRSDSNWETKTSSASGHKHTGSGAASLEGHLASKNKRYREGEDAMDDVITEAVTLRFSCPSRVQLAKVANYFSIGRATGGLGKIIVRPIQGTMGNWYFDVSSNEENQFLNPNHMNNILPAEVTVTRMTGGPVPTTQTASQDETRNVIRRMVEEKLKEAGEEDNRPFQVDEAWRGRRGPTKQQHRQDWMAKFSDHVTKLSPEHSGKIDWDTATYHYNQGKSPEDAAKSIVSRPPVNRMIRQGTAPY
jgi:hypothetical protein